MKTKLLILLFLPLFGYSQWWGDGIVLNQEQSLLYNRADTCCSIAAKDDGSKIYIYNPIKDTLFYYTTTDYDLSSLILNSSIKMGIPSTYTITSAIYIREEGDSNDGKNIFISVSGDTIYKFVLATAWDISTKSLTQKYNTGFSGYIDTFTFKRDGSRIYIWEQNDMYQRNLTVDWDITTITVDDTVAHIFTSWFCGAFVKETRLYELYNVGNNLFEYSMSDWDVGTILEDGGGYISPRQYWKVDYVSILRELAGLFFKYDRRFFLCINKREGKIKKYLF